MNVRTTLATLGALASTGCGQDSESGPVGGRAPLQVDCFQTLRDLSAGSGALFAFTASDVSPPTWWFGPTGVDTSGLAFESASESAATVTLEDGTVHLVHRTTLTAWDGGVGLYRREPGGERLQRSDDAGASWSDLVAPIAIDALSDPTSPIAAAHGDRVLLWARSLDFPRSYQAFISSDRGATFGALVPPEPGPQFRIVFHSAAIGHTGHVAVGLRSDIDGNEIHVWLTRDDGATWAKVFESPDTGHVATGDDGALWIASRQALWRSAGWDGTSTGGTVGTRLHGLVEADGIRPLVIGFPLIAQPGGRMGFHMIQGRPPGTTSSPALGFGYCVTGDKVTGSIVPVVGTSGPSVPVGTTPGRIEVAYTFPTPAHAFAVDRSGAILSHRVDASWDTMNAEVSRAGQPWFDTHDDAPAGVPRGLAPMDVRVPPDRDVVYLLVAPTRSAPESLGAVWELTPEGELTGTTIDIGRTPSGIAEEPVSLVAGPRGALLVRTRRGVFEVGPARYGDTLATGGEMAFDPVSGAVFYQDGAWLARAASTAGIYRDRCAEATIETQECLHVGEYAIGRFAVGADGYVYATRFPYLEVERRPIEAPTVGWQTVAAGFSGISGLALDTHEARTRLWVQDGATLWVGVLGETLPLTRQAAGP